MISGVDEKTDTQLVGLEEIIDFMRWIMFSPIVSPAAKSYGLRSQSVLLAGVPGTKSSDKTIIPS